MTFIEANLLLKVLNLLKELKWVKYKAIIFGLLGIDENPFFEQKLEKSLKSGISSDINKFDIIYEKKNPKTQNKLNIFLTPFCLRSLINESVSWNAINFGAVFVREPNIYFPTVDMFLSLFFKVTSNCFLSESSKN